MTVTVTVSVRTASVSDPTQSAWNEHPIIADDSDSARRRESRPAGGDHDDHDYVTRATRAAGHTHHHPSRSAVTVTAVTVAFVRVSESVVICQ